jgi:radical SAM superfamily enzyme YgiQ (UPF0313 family)
MTARRIALVCMTPESDAGELENARMPSYGIRRILAAVASDPALADSQVTLIDFSHADVDAYVDALVRFEADLVGFSVYVWSSLCLVEVARLLRQRRPGCAIVFGGPSARPAVFDLPPYGPAAAYLDAVVTTEGEAVFCEIARLPAIDRAGLRSIAGLHLPAAGTWVQTAHRAPRLDMDAIASPAQLNLLPEASVAYLETYRGCPLSCRFCEWGASETARSVFSVDYIARELASFARQRAQAVFLLDAGLNLNAKGFRNLLEAEAQVNVLRDMTFWAEVYPTLIKDEHLEFLARARTSYCGVGLQSLDPAVLKLHDRPFDRPRFEQAMARLRPVAQAELQIIMGLPGDTPEGFRRTLDYALSFGIGVRAYHCLVLPDALLTRGRPGWDMHFDPINLSMISCLGWRGQDIDAMRDELDAATRRAGGRAGAYWWSFPSTR